MALLAGSIAFYAIKRDTRYVAGSANSCNAISSARVSIHAVSICAHVILAPEAPMNVICPCSSVNSDARTQPYSIIVPGLSRALPEGRVHEQRLSELILTLALLVATLSHIKYNSCLVLLSLRNSAPSVSLVCGKHKQTVYYGKTYL